MSSIKITPLSLKSKATLKKTEDKRASLMQFFKEAEQSNREAYRRSHFISKWVSNLSLEDEKEFENVGWTLRLRANFEKAYENLEEK